MSAVIKTRGRNNLQMSTTALWLVLGLAVVFFLVNYGQELWLTHDLNNKSEAQRAVNQGIRDENTRLKALLQYYESDKYIEQRAREDLNLRRPDEEVLIPVGGTAAEGGLVSPGAARRGANQTPVATPPAAEANWQKWLELFAPSP